MLPDASLLISALVLGLLGSGHCLGMCGGFISALALTLPREHSHQRHALLLSYNLGRLMSYGLAGTLAGLLGWILVSTPLAITVRSVAAILLILMGLYLSGWWSGLRHIEKIGQGLWGKLQPIIQRLLPMNTHPKALLLGLLWGWLPCGLVYSTLLWAATQGNALHSLWLMLAFGLGTTPVLLVTGLAAKQMEQLLKKQSIRQLGGSLIILLGLWSLIGTQYHSLMGHHG